MALLMTVVEHANQVQLPLAFRGTPYLYRFPNG